jgi:hypothetical protein
MIRVEVKYSGSSVSGLRDHRSDRPFVLLALESLVSNGENPTAPYGLTVTRSRRSMICIVRFGATLDPLDEATGISEVEGTLDISASICGAYQLV